MTEPISGERIRPSAPSALAVSAAGAPHHEAPISVHGSAVHGSAVHGSAGHGSAVHGSLVRSSAAAGIAWMLVTTFLFVCQDSVTRHLLVFYPGIELAFVRFVIHLAAVAALVGLTNPRLMISRRPLVQIARSGFLLAATLLMMAALQIMPFVDATAVVWIAPVLVTALSVVFLGERAGLAGWFAVLAGMAGVWMIVGQDKIELTWAMAIPALAALANALYMIATRMLRGADPAITTLLYTGVMGTIVCTGLLPFVAIVPTVPDAFLMASLGALGTTSHFCMIRAFNAAPANIVAPFGYSSLVWSALLGAVLFAEIPQRNTLIGAGLIVGAGLVVIMHGRRE